MLKVSFDQAQGLITVVSRDLLTLAEVAYFDVEMKRYIATCKNKFGRVRILVLADKALVQTAVVNDAFSALPTFVPDKDDRMAILLSSSLAKLQVVRTLRNEREKAFLSEAEARRWLAGQTSDLR